MDIRYLFLDIPRSILEIELKSRVKITVLEDSTMKVSARVVLLLTGMVVSAGQVLASSEEDLAKAAQNPIANLISLPFQNNTNFGAGPDDRNQNVLNIQPVLPFTINEDWNLITRTILPVISQPLGDGGRKNGIGDTLFTAFFSPKDSGKITWGVGPAVLIPTSSNDALGAGDWGAGLSAVFLGMPGHWVVGSLFSNVWSEKAENQDRTTNLFTWQYFINYNIPESGGLYLTTAPVITANWEADSGNQWTVPFGGGIGKVFTIGKQPVNGQVSAYYNAEKPEFGPDWQLRLQLQLLFPK
jgi:hypothetical protein